MNDWNDLQNWAEHYGGRPDEERYQRIFLFGANPEVEEVLIRQGAGAGLWVLDDEVSLSLVGTRTWADGFREIRKQSRQHFWVCCGVASTPEKRIAAISRIDTQLEGVSNWIYVNVVAASAHVGEQVHMEKGVLVLDMAYVGPLCHLDHHSVLLPGARIYHGSRLGSFSILVGGSTVLGRATVRHSSRVCANAVVLPNGRIGPCATIGAGLSVKQLGREEQGNE